MSASSASLCARRIIACAPPRSEKKSTSRHSKSEPVLKSAYRQIKVLCVKEHERAEQDMW